MSVSGVASGHAGRVRPLPLFIAVALLSALWSGPFSPFAPFGGGAGTFTGHMILHMGIVACAAPLLVLALPGLPRLVDRIAPPLAAAPLAAMVEFVVVWGWHTPALCGLAQTSPTAFVAEQVSWVVVGVLLWATVLRPVVAQGLALWAGVLALLLTGMHMTLLGTLITLAQHPQYGSPLVDQQFGGLIMLAVGAVVYTGPGLALARRGLAVEDEKSASAS